MKHAFVTGAAGFIGRHTASEFVARGWRVTALVHRRSSPMLDELAERGAVTLVRGDATDPSSFREALRSALHEGNGRLDALVHVAGRASDVGRSCEFRRANFDSVRKLAGLAGELRAGRFVFVSTTDVYGMRDFDGESEDQLPMTDAPVNPYPEFKIEAEKWIRENCPPDRYSIVRPAAVWGADDTTLTKRVADFLKVSPWIIHFGPWRGKNRWPLAHVRNVAAALVLASTSPRAAGVAINVLDTEFTTVDEFYRIVARVHCPRRRYGTLTLPLWAVRPLASAVTGLSDLLNLDHPFMDPSSYALRVVSSNLHFDNSRFLALLREGGRRPVTREEGVGELLNNCGQGHRPKRLLRIVEGTATRS